MGIFGTIIAKTIGKVADSAGGISKDITKQKLAKFGDKTQLEGNEHEEFIEMLKYRGGNSYQANNRNWYDSFVDGLNRLVFPLTAFPFIYLLWRLAVTDPQKLLTALGAAGLLTIIGTLLGVRQIGKKIALNKEVKTFILPEKKKEIPKTDKITTNSKLPKVNKFIKDYGKYALKIESEYGLNAIGILSHGALESGWGEKVLTGYSTKTKKSINTNNVFNIKNSKSWNGKTAVRNVWEMENGKDIKIDQEFRVYDSVLASFEDYANLLSKLSRYEPVMEAESPEVYAKELLKCGYMTDINAPEKIIKISKMLNISQ